jgi:hypothetical protein
VRRALSRRFLAFALTPTLVLLLAAETTVRLKYFFSPYGRDWTYLTTPIGRGSALAATNAPAAAPVSPGGGEDEASDGQNIPIVDILDPVEALGESARYELFTDLGHLTIKGDRLVGQLIAKSLGEFVSW